jgi:hypothetical protein
MKRPGLRKALSVYFLMHFLPSVPTRLRNQSNGAKDRKMKKYAPLIAAVVWTFALMACSGTMKGIDRSSGKRVFFTYTGEKFGAAEIRVTLPDGEHFVGRLVEESAPTGENSPSTETYPAVDEFSGNTEALLEGDRGHSMKCKFRLSDKVLGFKSGGFGLCETINGRVIDIFTR